MRRNDKNRLRLPHSSCVKRTLQCWDYSHYSNNPSRSPPDCELLTDVTLAFGHFPTGLWAAVTKPTKIGLPLELLHDPGTVT